MAARQKKNTPSAPAIVWFRNDLRLADNAALRAACEPGAPILPVFILDEHAQGAWAPGGASRWWLHQSLKALHGSLEAKGSRLILRSGDAGAVLSALADDTGARTVYCARRYEPWAIRQEATVRTALERIGVTLKRYGGALLLEPEQIATGSGEPYKVYTPFWHALTKIYTGPRPQRAPAAIPAPSSWPRSAKLMDWALQPDRPNWARAFAEHWKPGEEGALGQLATFVERAAASYTQDRNRPDRAGTSRLSPHLAHGEISPRLLWYRARTAMDEDPAAAGGLETFLKELVWREFSAHLLFHFPHFPEQPFRKAFAAFPWNTDAAALRAWQRGRTGYPIVDAGMRELWATGWMHNRVRMIVASFLIKDLMISWQEGEAWFWDTLADADLANNACSWQWVAGSGADAAPYFRIFNPITQGEKFDPDGEYVRRWVPEIARLSGKQVHKPFAIDAPTLRAAGIILGDTYPEPIVDHAAARKRALAAFAAIKG